MDSAVGTIDFDHLVEDLYVMVLLLLPQETQKYKKYLLFFTGWDHLMV